MYSKPKCSFYIYISFKQSWSKNSKLFWCFKGLCSFTQNQFLQFSFFSSSICNFCQAPVLWLGEISLSLREKVNGMISYLPFAFISILPPIINDHKIGSNCEYLLWMSLTLLLSLVVFCGFLRTGGVWIFIILYEPTNSNLTVRILYEHFREAGVESKQFQTNWLAWVCKKEKQGCSQIDIFIFIIVKTSSDFQRIIALTEANLPFEPRCPSVGWLVIMSKRAGQLHFHSFHTPINIFIFFINIVYIIIIIIAFYSSVTAAPWWEANTIWYS